MILGSSTNERLKETVPSSIVGTRIIQNTYLHSTYLKKLFDVFCDICLDSFGCSITPENFDRCYGFEGLNIRGFQMI